MNEREDFLKHFRSAFIRMVEGIDTMTETQVLDGLKEVKVARNIYDDAFAERMQEIAETQTSGRSPEAKAPPGNDAEMMAYLRSIQDFYGAIAALKSQLGTKARPGGSTPDLMDSLEVALNLRLETLRKQDEA